MRLHPGAACLVLNELRDLRVVAIRDQTQHIFHGTLCSVRTPTRYARAGPRSAKQCTDEPQLGRAGVRVTSMIDTCRFICTLVARVVAAWSAINLREPRVAYPPRIQSSDLQLRTGLDVAGARADRGVFCATPSNRTERTSIPRRHRLGGECVVAIAPT
jgi:hypothetical protein